MTNKEVINFLNQVRKILLDDKSWLESTIQPINEAFDMAINALTAQPEETYDKRTEMHACDCVSRQAAIDAMCELMHHWYGGDPKDEIREIKRELEKLPSAQPDACENTCEIARTSNDCISRQAAIDALDGEIEITGRTNAEAVKGYVRLVRDRLERLPSVHPDLSSYSDKLWHNAYERGKAEAEANIIRCKDCKYWREHKYAKETKRYIPFCGFNAIYTKSDDFCSRAERRTDG